MRQLAHSLRPPPRALVVSHAASCSQQPLATSTPGCGRGRGRRRPLPGSQRGLASAAAPRTLVEAATWLREGRTTPTALTRHCLRRQAETVGLNAFVTATADAALEAAERLEKAQGGQSSGSGSGSPTTDFLRGVPLAVKDNFCTAGVRTTASSRMLGEFVPPYDATPVARLKARGAVLVGKTNMDEFGMGSATIFSHFGPTVNPWSPPHDPSVRLVAGGSSGGSAVAVATGACYAALGSDTGGSVRQPAALCGLVGFKPTYGRISRHGLVAYASSLDCPGVLARTVADAALVLDAIAGPDRHDSTCLPTPLPAPDAFFREAEAAGPTPSRPLAGLRVGVPGEFRVAEMDKAVVAAWEDGARLLAAAGAQVVPVSVPSVPLALPTYFVIACAEASSNLARYDGIRYGHRAARVHQHGVRGGVSGSGASSTQATGGGEEDQDQDQGALHRFITACRSEGFGAEVQRRVLAGAHVLSAKAYSAYYERALAARVRLRRDFAAALAEVDVMLTPVTPSGPFPLAQPAEPAALMLNDVMTIPPSLAGLPAVSVPVSVVEARYPGAAAPVPVPLGLQLIGRPLGEGVLLRVAAALEARCDFAAQVPDYVGAGSR